MYCIKCGVKLAEHQKQCPLCSTVVFHPDIQPSGDLPYPAQRQPAPQMRSHAALVIVTTLFLIPLLITLLCDYQINKRYFQTRDTNVIFEHTALYQVLTRTWVPNML